MNDFYLKKHMKKSVYEAPERKQTNKQDQKKQIQKKEQKITKKQVQDEKPQRKNKEKSEGVGKRKKEERPQIEEFGLDGNESDHSVGWKQKNATEISADDQEIKMLERKLGIRTDSKRQKRFFTRIEQEGLGVGIFDFLNEIESKAKLSRDEYERPSSDYKFNDPKFETAVGDSDIEGGVEAAE